MFREQGRLALLSQVRNMQTLENIDVGDWSSAAACAEEARRLARDTGQPLWDIAITSLVAMLAGLRGDLERALGLAGEAEAGASSRRLNDLLCCVQLARGFAWISTGHHTKAYDHLRRVFDPDDPAFHLTARFHGVTFLAEAAVHAGQVDDARSVVAGLELEAKVTPSPTLHIGLSYAVAVLARDDEAEALYLAALGQDLVRWPWARGRLELAYGCWLRRQRRSAESRPLLRSALTTLEVVGATTWADQARVELRAAGERPQASAPAAHEALSPQELQIALLATEGLSNKEIGERLYMSHRTVGSHLYRIFPKLDITSRAQLASRLSST
jgi:ATP/maltotriose-dependent transcriptional regulator MalT